MVRMASAITSSIAVLVLSGETQPADVEAAAVADKPDFVFNSLADVDKVMFGE